MNTPTQITAKHTPGPWTYAKMHLGPHVKDRRCGFVVNGPDTGDGLPVRICDLRTPQGIDGYREGESNAAAIAAIPDLLTSLEKCLSWAQTYKRVYNVSEEGPLAADIDEALRAIEKAKGLSCKNYSTT